MRGGDAELVSVIASGWSLASIDLARIPGLRIGVNDSSWRTRCSLGVTMDRLYFEGRQPQLLKAFPAYSGAAFYYRRSIDKGGIAPEHWLGFDNDHESVDMATDWTPRTRLNGLNSGICAINLAFRIKPSRVILWGFDMCRSPKGAAYYHEPYPWAPEPATKPGKYASWVTAFHRIAAQFAEAKIELINASPASAILGIRKMDPKGLLS